MKPVLVCIAFLAALVARPCVFAGAEGSRRPNVLLIGADDLRTNLGCYGDRIAITPNIDRLARRGVRFERAYCQQAVCNPSRASVLTGFRPDTLRVWSLARHFRETTPSAVTLPQFFKMHGYYAQGIGKVFHINDAPSWSVAPVLHTHADHKRPLAVDGPVPPDQARVVGTEIRDVPDNAYFDGMVADRAIEALRSMKGRDEPFFLAVGFWKPHRPYNPPKKYWDLYRADSMPPPLNPEGTRGAPAVATMSAEEDFLAAVRQAPEAAAELRRGYYASTTYLDAQVGRVVGELDRLNLAENTIIVFWSDHGFNLGDHGIWGKTTCFETDARVPLIISLPGNSPRGVAAGSLVELVDLYPTLVEACGFAAAPDLQGRSLLGVLKDPRVRVKDAAFTQHPRPWDMVPDRRSNESEVMGYSVRTAEGRYTEWRDWKTGRALAVELYDHRAGDDEDVNQAGSLEYLALQRELAARLEGQFPRSAIRP